MMECKYVIDADDMTVSDAYALILYVAAHDTTNALGTFVIDMFQEDKEDVHHVPYYPPFCNDGICRGTVIWFADNSVEIVNNGEYVELTFYCEGERIFYYVITPDIISRLFDNEEV